MDFQQNTVKMLQFSHEINQFCSGHTVQEVLIDKFNTLDESLKESLQKGCNEWAPGIESNHKLSKLSQWESPSRQCHRWLPKITKRGKPRGLSCSSKRKSRSWEKRSLKYRRRFRRSRQKHRTRFLRQATRSIWRKSRRTKKSLQSRTA